MTSWADIRAALDEWLFANGPGGTERILVTAVVIYVVALVVVRVGKKRFIGRSAVSDAILGFMLGSTLARTINGGAPLLATIGAAFVLVLLHWLIGAIATHSERVSRLIAGKPHVLVRDGKLDHHELHSHNLNHADLDEAMHESGIPGDLDQVELARFERNGGISIIPRHRAQVIDIEVENGVQTVRVVLEGRA